MTLAEHDRATFIRRLVALDGPASLDAIENRTVRADLFGVADYLPDSFVDLLFVDPPYNLDKSFNGTPFREVPVVEYRRWIESWLTRLIRCLKPTASIYICSDWRSSAAIQLAAGKHLILRNRITWEREKGRGARRNWKNCSEDIWFFTRSDEYYFDVDAVKLKRRVIAPYTENGKPKDWARTSAGNFRDTHPSNLWTDLTVPFWSMPENTDHPTQKPEKLLAKVILASSRPGDLVLDPFQGSGTTSVVAKKLGRRFVGIEIDETYCCLAEKRLARADTESSIQGYADGVFWERNTHQLQRADASPRVSSTSGSLFD
ncbi:MAG: site-specific DNA-methyltransferase [Acidobacteria bacterium]|nr:site-specific DNA-methyltransferase [Acidobacteriota bacterium]